jgi:predicted phosphodiesterase
MTKKVVVIPDVHLPDENRRAVPAVIKFIGDYQPDEVVQLGDLMDYPQPSRWSKGTAAEFEGSVFRDSAYAQEHFLKPLREVYSGPVGVIPGNHDIRPKVYLGKYAPALAESGAFDLGSLLDFSNYEVSTLPDFYPVARGWVIMHGHLGGVSSSRIAGNTALNAAARLGASVVMGHIHRLAVSHHTTGFNGKVTTLRTGVESGHLMDIRKADYLDGGVANWQLGFVILHISGQYVFPQAVRVDGNRFVVDGIVYEI